jgi:hypothetical protein
MKTNNAGLAQLVEQCFSLSMNGDIKESDRKDFLAIGKRLRGSLLNLLTAEFEEGTQEVIDANSRISDLNKNLITVTQNLQQVADVVKQIGQLVTILDDLLKIAASFK